MEEHDGLSHFQPHTSSSHCIAARTSSNTAQRLDSTSLEVWERCEKGAAECVRRPHLAPLSSVHSSTVTSTRPSPPVGCGEGSCASAEEGPAPAPPPEPRASASPCDLLASCCCCCCLRRRCLSHLLRRQRQPSPQAAAHVPPGSRYCQPSASHWACPAAAACCLACCLPASTYQSPAQYQPAAWGNATWERGRERVRLKQRVLPQAQSLRV